MTRDHSPLFLFLLALVCVVALMAVAKNTMDEADACGRRCPSGDSVWLRGYGGPVCVCRSEVAR